MGYKGDMKKAVKADLVEKYLKVFYTVSFTQSWPRIVEE